MLWTHICKNGVSLHILRSHKTLPIHSQQLGTYDVLRLFWAQSLQIPWWHVVVYNKKYSNKYPLLFPPISTSHCLHPNLVQTALILLKILSLWDEMRKHPEKPSNEIYQKTPPQSRSFCLLTYGLELFVFWQNLSQKWFVDVWIFEKNLKQHMDYNDDSWWQKEKNNLRRVAPMAPHLGPSKDHTIKFKDIIPEPK